MIIKLANRWADWLVTNGAVSEDHDIYVYGAEYILNEIISDFLLIFTGFLFNKVFEVFAWMLFFTPLRIHLGGTHASSHLKCIISSVFLCYICVYAYPLVVNYPVLTAVISLISLVTVFKIAPVVHPNHPVSDARMKKMRKMALLIVCIEVIISAIAYIYFSKMFGGMGLVSVFSVCVLGILGKLHSTVKIENTEV
ncbi:MAG: accessory gene regulator B family protein [Lachnospiraceae bacterium]|nr:accessory gene regulator B family protein [Lachnospiraceae bacterium]